MDKIHALEKRVQELENLAETIKEIAQYIKKNGYPSEDQFFTILYYLMYPDSSECKRELNEQKEN